MPPTPGSEPRAGRDDRHVTRRRFLGLCAGAALGAAAAASAPPLPGRPPVAPEFHRAETERDRPMTPVRRIGSAGPPDAVTGHADRVSLTPGYGAG